jgi:hypothetical protein
MSRCCNTFCGDEYSVASRESSCFYPVLPQVRYSWFQLIEHSRSIRSRLRKDYGPLQLLQIRRCYHTIPRGSTLSTILTSTCHNFFWCSRRRTPSFASPSFALLVNCTALMWILATILMRPGRSWSSAWKARSRQIYSREDAS